MQYSEADRRRARARAMTRALQTCGAKAQSANKVEPRSFAVAGGSGSAAPDNHFCPSCGHGPLLSCERAGDGCCKCKETQPITLTEADVESAIRAFVCACRPELAVGWRIDVRVRLLGGAASATAWRSPNIRNLPRDEHA